MPTMIASSFPRLFQQQHDDKLDLVTPRRGRLDTSSTADTYSSGSSSLSSRVEEEDIQLNVQSPQALNNVWKDLKRGGYKNTRTLKMTFKAESSVVVSKMKNLENVLEALGKLPKLEEIAFSQSALFLPYVNKLLKKTTKLRSLKFHQCKFILSTKGHGKDNAKAVDKLWKGMEAQKDLAVLEILDCCCLESEQEAKKITKFSFPMPHFLQQEQTMPGLRRVVLDECIMDGSDHTAFVSLVNYHPALEELEIRPKFETNTVRRLEYGARKIAIHNFMTQTIPNTLSNNSSLRKLAIALDDYQLVHVYFDAMTQWVDLVRNDNDLLNDLRASQSLPSSVSGVFVDWETVGIFADAAGNGIEVFSNDGNGEDEENSHDEIGFHVRRSPAASC